MNAIERVQFFHFLESGVRVVDFCFFFGFVRGARAFSRSSRAAVMVRRAQARILHPYRQGCITKWKRRFQAKPVTWIIYMSESNVNDVQQITEVVMLFKLRYINYKAQFICYYGNFVWKDITYILIVWVGKVRKNMSL